MPNEDIRIVEGPCPRCVASAIRASGKALDGKSKMVLQGDKLRCLRCNAVHDLASLCNDLANCIAKNAAEQMRLQIEIGVSVPVTWCYHHGYDATIFLVDMLQAASQALDEKTLRATNGVTH